MKQLENEGSGRWGVKAQSLDEAVPTPKWSSLPPEPVKEEPKQEEKKFVKKYRYFLLDMPGLGVTGMNGCLMTEQPPKELKKLVITRENAINLARRMESGADVKRFPKHVEFIFTLRKTTDDGDAWYDLAKIL